MHGAGFVKHRSERSGYPWAFWCACWPWYSRAKAPPGALPSPAVFQPFFWIAQTTPEFAMEAASARGPTALCDPAHGLLGLRVSEEAARAAPHEGLHM